MNAKSHLIEITPAIGPCERFHRWSRPAVDVATIRAVQTQDAAQPSKTGLWLALWSEGRAGEFWETVAYTVIWLCGLLGIGLCAC
jgi:hypothetical protein